MTVDSVVKDIKTLKIQGASNVAKAALTAFMHSSNRNAAAKKLIKARPTEPMLKNLLRLATYENPEKLLGTLASDADKITVFGARKLSQYKSVYTHCHSSSVMKIIKAIKPKVVYVTETRPLYQGRITAEELASAGIKVVYFVDAAMRLAIKRADVVLIGADAITSDGKVINKVGTSLAAEIAEKHSTPFHVCTHSLKYDPRTEFGFDTEIEKRHAGEVWKRAPKGVKISNYAFERIHPDQITTIISDLGVLAPEAFLEAFNKKWPEL